VCVGEGEEPAPFFCASASNTKVRGTKIDILGRGIENATQSTSEFPHTSLHWSSPLQWYIDFVPKRAYHLRQVALITYTQPTAVEY